MYNQGLESIVCLETASQITKLKLDIQVAINKGEDFANNC